MIVWKDLGLMPYQEVWQDMKAFTVQRNEQTPDECWLLEHLPVYTQGQAGRAEHVLSLQGIPLVQSDRGGQITYHGPGQLISYVLVDLTRKGRGIKTFVRQLEQTIINLLAHYQIEGSLQSGAPGVYVDNKKIASIGLRVKNGCTYHGLALNVAMDLAPFQGIHPCGFPSMKMTQLQDFVANISLEEVKKQFVIHFLQQIG